MAFEKLFTGIGYIDPEPAISTLMILALKKLGGRLQVSHMAAFLAERDGSFITIDQDPVNHGWVLSLRGPKAPEPTPDFIDAAIQEAMEGLPTLPEVAPPTLPCLRWDIPIEGPGSEGAPI